MEESGISLSFDLGLAEEIDANYLEFDFPELENEICLSLPQEIDYHELKSKTIPDIENPPSFKTATTTLRTQFKQQLQREQWKQQEQERRKVEQEQKEKKEASKPLRVPIDIQAIELPEQVLKVKTGLKNPTLYHMKEKQKHQVIQYLSSSQQDGFLGIQNAITDNGKVRSITALRKPEVVHSAPLTSNRLHPKVPVQISTSACNPRVPSPEIMSPGMSSVATSTGTSDAEDILEDILSIEEETTRSNYESLCNQTFDMYKKNNSCPPGLSQIKNESSSYGEAEHTNTRERIKKDNHNMIERRRRFNINDRIKELGDLLPKNRDPHYDLVRDLRPNKGTILKSSVDYIKLLKTDVEKMKYLEVHNKKLEQQNRNLLLKIQKLELQAKQHGIPVTDSTWQVTNPSTIINTIMKNPQPRGYTYQKMPDVISEVGSRQINVEPMDEDEKIVKNDPMMSSPLSLLSSSSPEGDVDMNIS